MKRLLWLGLWLLFAAPAAQAGSLEDAAALYEQGDFRGALEMAEAGADYVGLANAAEGGLDLVEWWGELFEVPCVALDPVEPEEAGELARRGADFVVPAQAMWASPARAREVVAATLRALDEGAL